jgi:hypothetical protein
MQDAAEGRLGRTARFLLLLATLLGLTAMHTLGHGGPHGAAAHDQTATAGHTAAAASTALMMTATGRCLSDGCEVLLTGPASGHGGMTGWDVCLAILVAFAVVLLTAALLRTRAGTGLPAARGGTAGHAGPRAPPPRAVGLTLATVSVLRT